MQFKGKKLRTIDLCICSTTKNKIIADKELKVKELYEKIGNGITDYNRESVI